MRAALTLAFLIPAHAFAADAWLELVEKGATRVQVAEALGKPEIEFTAFVPKGEQPLQISPSLPDPPEPGAEVDFSDDELLRVMQYPGRKRGLDYQVVLKDEKVWYAVGPPLADEEALGAVTKKFGKAPIQTVQVLFADLLRTWDLIRYPDKRRAFIREPGGGPILARIVYQPPT